MGKPTEKQKDLSWLADIADRGPELNDSKPIWVRHAQIVSDAPVSVPHRHAYCELDILVSGSIVQYAESESIRRETGSMFIAGPGVPHWSTVISFPVEYYVIYFKPWALMNNGSGVDAWQILKRCTARQSLAERVINPSNEVGELMLNNMLAMYRECEGQAFGREMKLVAFLNNILVDLWRWEHQNGRTETVPKPHIKWRELELALSYIHDHYRDQIYGREIAAAARISESNLEMLFREAIGMPWVRYLQRYRVQQAASFLVENECNITEAALQVGFNSLSHFNSAFRAVMGLSPSQYVKQMKA